MAAERIVRRRPGPCRPSACPASRSTGSTRSTPGTAALLARNRALANAFFAGRADLEVAPMTSGITAFPRLLRGDVDALDAPAARATTTPRSSPAASSASPTISGSASAARPRSSRPGSSGSARRWTRWHEEGRHRRILPPARRAHARPRDRARIGQRLHLAGRGRALRPGDRRRRQPRDPRPVREGDDAASRCSRSARKG